VRFHIEQRYERPAAEVLAAYADPDLYPALVGLTRVATPVVLERTQDGERTTLRLQMRFVADISSAARRVVDPARLTWVQEETYDPAALSAQVVFHPDHYADRLSCRGGYAFVPDEGGGSIRQVHGDLRVRVPLVGGQVERALVSGLQDHFAEEQPLVAAWLDAHPA
jgi:hypothetical protein